MFLLWKLSYVCDNRITNFMSTQKKMIYVRDMHKTILAFTKLQIFVNELLKTLTYFQIKQKIFYWPKKFFAAYWWSLRTIGQFWQELSQTHVYIKNVCTNIC